MLGTQALNNESAAYFVNAVLSDDITSMAFPLHRCRVRVIDTFGTEPAYNHEEYATLHGFRTNWGYWNLNPKQFMTMFRKWLQIVFLVIYHEDVVWVCQI